MFLFTFVYYSPSVHAVYLKATENNVPAVNLLENYNPLGAHLISIRKDLEQILKQLQVDTDIKEQQVAIETKLNTLADMKRHWLETLDQQYADLESSLSKGKKDHFQKNRMELITRFSQVENQVNSFIKTDIATLQSPKTLQAYKASVIQTIQQLGNGQFQRSAQSSDAGFDFITPPPRNIHTQLSQVQALVGYVGEPAVDASAYLQQNSEIQFTPEIIQTVESIGNNPIELYNWIHNEINWIPSYGSIQGADSVLSTKQGNAFDTASLLIALYRYAGIPARYVYGVKTFSAEEMKNWVGGVDNPAAVQNLLSQGGIPHIASTRGGDIEQFKMEHVWVEAKLEGDTWTALDPSFKQYVFHEGDDLKNKVPFDAQGLIAAIETSTEQNEAEGWVRGLDPVVVKERIDQYQIQVKSYLESLPEGTTLGDLTGYKDIIPSEVSSINELSDLSSDIQFQQPLPSFNENLRYRFIVDLGTAFNSLYANTTYGSQIFQYKADTTQLAGKNIALSFRPATTEDELILNNSLPAPVNELSDLPSSLPAHLVNVVGELTVDGVVVAQTGAIPFGDEVALRLGYQAPQQQWKYSENFLIAGEYHAIGLDLQGASKKQLERIKDGLENAATKLEAEEFGSLTKHNSMGLVMQTGIHGYFANLDIMDQLAAPLSKVVSYRAPSFGRFSTNIQVSYSWGIPQVVHFSGLMMDIDRVQSNNESRYNCYDDWLAFNINSGMQSSAYEHLIPEMLFSTEDNSVEAVSAVKALSVASAEGQKIFRLTSDNADQLSSLQMDTGVRSEIQSALNQGLEVTVHEMEVNYAGWQGTGYIVLDPDVGVGAYKISSGASGGWVETALDSLLGLVGIDVNSDNVISVFLSAIEAFIDSVNQRLSTQETIFLVMAAVISAIIMAIVMYALFITLVGIGAMTGASAGLLIRFVGAMMAVYAGVVLFSRPTVIHD
ncbi:transglutaminase family protein [Motiliproteus sp. MSK22-1]|uniref:transglutaminase-like domain-containing protein n=1 Tax=Motiliproteus sp. MSK22-1 TaxID=1897630 RepID=UPI001E376262|nr:transglutaminase-like domain-containing protein [Motiliproteus sp. MSK22-1]